MDSIVDYDIISGSSEEDILIDVKMMINSLNNKDTCVSWRPQGGIAAVQKSNGECTFYQAMVLVKEEEYSGGSSYYKNKDIDYLD